MAGVAGRRPRGGAEAGRARGHAPPGPGARAPPAPGGRPGGRGGHTTPHRPPASALRTERYKFIQYHGIWDTDELYDLQSDPHETTNLIRDPKHQETVRQMREALHEQLVATGGTSIPLGKKRGGGANLRGLDERLRHETGMPILIADNPLHSVAIGSGRCVEDFDALQQVLVSERKRH